MKSNNDFYQNLRDKIVNWANSDDGRTNSITEYILLVPDFFYLLIKLIVDDRVGVKEKAVLGLAIAYFVSPIDLIPEGVLGPIGYADDLIVAAKACMYIINNSGEEVVKDCWPGEGDVLTAVKKVLDSIDEIIPNDIFNKLKKLFSFFEES
jgi:uncharacterized membrane protein YkvA (DUF1232 family)